MILAESGIRVSAKRVSAIMQELDLHSVRTDAKKLYSKAATAKTKLAGTGVHSKSTKSNLGK